MTRLEMTRLWEASLARVCDWGGGCGKRAGVLAPYTIPSNPGVAISGMMTIPIAKMSVYLMTHTDALSRTQRHSVALRCAKIHSDGK